MLASGMRFEDLVLNSGQNLERQTMNIGKLESSSLDFYKPGALTSHK
jgi:hypothetical protein